MPEKIDIKVQKILETGGNPTVEVGISFNRSPIEGSNGVVARTEEPNKSLIKKGKSSKASVFIHIKSWIEFIGGLVGLVKDIVSLGGL